MRKHAHDSGRKALAYDDDASEGDEASETGSHLGYYEDSDASMSDDDSVASLNPAASPLLPQQQSSPRAPAAALSGAPTVSKRRIGFRRRRYSAPSIPPQQKAAPAPAGGAGSANDLAGPPPLVLSSAVATVPVGSEQQEERRRRGLFGRHKSSVAKAASQMKANRGGSSNGNGAAPLGPTTAAAAAAAGAAAAAAVNGASGTGLAPRPKSGNASRGFPPPQAMHRIRLGADGKALSSDPDFFPPVPLEGDAAAAAEGCGSGGGGGSGRGCVRYGDYLRMWATSKFVQPSKSGYVGYIRRVNRRRHALGKGELFVVPPVPVSPLVIFHDACFKVVDPRSEEGERDGELLRYGEEFTLVDDRGMVWNNKDGRFHGRLGPSLFGNGGHMFMTLCRPDQTGAALAAVRGGGLFAPSPTRSAAISSANASPTGAAGQASLMDLSNSGCASGADDAAPAAAAFTASGAAAAAAAAAAASGAVVGALGEPVKYGDSCAIIAKKVRPRGGQDGGERAPVVRAAVTHSLRRHQAGVGGFLRSDGKGKPFEFIVHHAPPRVTAVAVYAVGADGRVVETHTHHKVPWNQEVEFDLPTLPPPQALAVAPTAPVSRAQSAPAPRSQLGDSPKGAGALSADARSATASGASAAGSPPRRPRWGDLEAEGGGPPIVEVGLSTGGKLVLRRADLLRCRDRSYWFDAGDEQHPMCIKVRSRSLSSHGDPAAVAARSGRSKLVLLGLAAAVAAVARIAACRLVGWACGGRWRVESFVLEVLWEALVMALVLAVTVQQCKDVLGQKGAAGGGGGGHSALGATSAVRIERCALKLIRCETRWAAELREMDGDESDDDVAAPELPPMPETFMLAENGDVERAMQRWRDTLQWRRENKADEALTTPHPMFDLMKSWYPTAFHGRDKEGSVVYYEQLGGIDYETMRANGVDSKKLLWHYMYQMEYLWTVINPKVEDRTTIVLDMKGVGLGDIGGETIAFVKTAVSMLATHYPARSNCIFIVNVPTWFNYLYKLIKPILNETTQRKIRLCTASNYQKLLADWVGEENVPKEYGGRSPYPLFEHTWEVEMRNSVLKTLALHGLDMQTLPASKQ